MSVLNQIWIGFSAPFSGLMYIKSRPTLIVLSIIPFAVFAISILSGFVLTNSHPEIIDSVASYTGLMSSTGWFGWLIKLMVRAVVWLSTFFLIFVASYFTFQVIMGPFSSLLSEKTLIQTGALQEKPFKVGEWVVRNIKMFRVSLVKSIVLLLFAIILFILSVVPILNIISAMGFWLIMTFDCADFSFENLGFSFRERIAFFIKNIFSFFGFALCMGLILIVPIVNFFLYPAAIVGSGILISEIKKV